MLRRRQSFASCQDWTTHDERQGEKHRTCPPYVLHTTLTLLQTRNLLDLPAELWAKIGRCAIDAAETYNPLASKDLSTHAQDVTHVEERYHQPAILRTCRILREELLPYFYATKIQLYIFADNGMRRENMLIFGQWLRAVNDKCRCHVGGVSLHTNEEMRDIFKGMVEKEDWLVQIEFGENISLLGTPTYLIRFL